MWDIYFFPKEKNIFSEKFFSKIYKFQKITKIHEHEQYKIFTEQTGN